MRAVERVGQGKQQKRGCGTHSLKSPRSDRKLGPCSSEPGETLKSQVDRDKINGKSGVAEKPSKKKVDMPPIPQTSLQNILQQETRNTAEQAVIVHREEAWR